jgi:hypothetical protein
VFKILHVLQFVVSHLEITHCSSESLTSKASYKWTEQRCNCKFVLRVVIWVSSIVRPPKWSSVKAAILCHGGNFRNHRYGNLLIYRVYRLNVLSPIHMSVFNGIGMWGSALHNIAKNNGTILILMLAEWEIWSIIKRPSKWSPSYDDTENQYFFYGIIYVVVTARFIYVKI